MTDLGPSTISGSTRDFTVVRRATIEDVAGLSGLSTATVSRVFASSETSTIVTPSTRRKVMSAAQRVGYQPHWIARAFAAGRTNLVGLLYQGNVPILDSIYRDMVATFSDALRARGYHLMFIPVVENESYWRQMLNAGAVDACVALEMIDGAMFDAIRESALPAVLLNAGDQYDLSRVMVDDRAAAQMLTEHLLRLGHRRILFYVSENAHAGHYSIDWRREGFFDAMRAQGIAPEELFFQGTPEAMHERVLRSRDFSAVICYSHMEVLPLLQFVARHGVKVPGQLSIASFNDVYPMQFTIPPLTTMSIPGSDIGAVGAELLLEQLDARIARPVRVRPEITRRVLACRLVQRESTGQV